MKTNLWRVKAVPCDVLLFSLRRGKQSDLLKKSVLVVQGILQNDEHGKVSEDYQKASRTKNLLCQRYACLVVVFPVFTLSRSIFFSLQ